MNYFFRSAGAIIRFSAGAKTGRTISRSRHTPAGGGWSGEKEQCGAPAFQVTPCTRSR